MKFFGHFRFGTGRLGRSFTAVVIATILATFALLRVVGWLYRIDLPTVWDNGPAQNALAVHWLRSGFTLYPDVRTWFAGNVYGPVSFLLAAMITPLFGHGVLAAMTAGRSLVIASTLVASIMIFMLSGGAGASTIASLIASLAFLCSPLLRVWGFAFRVDMPALAFGLTGLWVFQEGYELCAVFFCLLAFFTKQSSGAAMAAIVLFLWFGGRRGRAMALASMWLGAAIAITSLFQWIWPHYLLSTFTGIRASFLDFRAPPSFLLKTLKYDFVLAFLAAAAIVYGRASRLAMLFLAMALLNNVTIAVRWGSNLYYFLPTIAAVSIVAAPQIDWIIDKSVRLSKSLQLSCAASLALALVIFNLHGQFDRFIRSPFSIILPTRTYHDPYDTRSLRALRSIQGLVVTDEPSLMMVDHPHGLRIISLMILEGMKSHGKFNDARLLAEIRCHRIAAFALSGQKLDRKYRRRRFFWPDLRRAIKANYAFASTAGPPFLMLPKSGMMECRHSKRVAATDRVRVHISSAR